MAVKYVLFIFNDILYCQKDGIGMGNPLGPTLANVFLCYYEKLWLNNCPVEFKPVFYRRYIDDTFMLFKSRDHVPLFLNYLNNKHPNIKFTHEVEDNYKLIFLDIMVYRINNCFETSISRKNTFTGLGMRFDSFIPYKYKINLISCLVTRAFRICSRLCSFEEEIAYLKNYFTQNKFPINIVNKTIKSTLKHLYTNSETKLTVPLKQIYVNIPYLGFHSEKLKRTINSITKQFFPHINLRFLYQTQNTVGMYFRFKDRLPLSLTSSVIYKYSCGQCPASYIGETRKLMKVRMSQHKGRSFRTNNLLNEPENSKIFEHSINFNHKISDNYFKIIDKCSEFDLRILESIHINENKPTLNCMSSSYDLLIVK